ncbi:MAG TPA: hypothetical protein PKC49_16095, partial [Phycisphaerae bacterium]|nr:hypothetical protein [Phycisphaerae bacterium]
MLRRVRPQGHRALAILLAVCAAAPALGQQRVEQGIDSGFVSAGPRAGRAEPRVVFTTVVRAPGARWIQLRFGEVELADRAPRGDQAYLEISSLLDGGTQ